MRKPKIELGTIVADRTYEWRRGKTAGSLIVRIGTPQRDSLPGGDWLCPVEISGAPRGSGISATVRPVYGVDQMQTVILALGYVQIMLAHLARRVELTWLGSIELGLPDILGHPGNGDSAIVAD